MLQTDNFVSNGAAPNLYATLRVILRSGRAVRSDKEMNLSVQNQTRETPGGQPERRDPAPGHEICLPNSARSPCLQLREPLCSLVAGRGEA